ncbi:MAG: LacI family DNA-binding transcriptional regulator [bacterium]
MATIFDIAEKAKVSVMTVSRVMNNPDIVSEKTISKVHQVMDEFGYQPSQIARSLVKKRTNTIGVIMPDIKNTFFNSLFRIFEEYAISHHYNLLLCNTDEKSDDELRYIKLFQSQRVDGILIAPSSKKSVEYLQKSGMNFIAVDRNFEEMKTDIITTDHFSGAFEATEYLIKLGHKKIAVLKGPGSLIPDIERYSGFENAMVKNNLPIKNEFIFDCCFDESKAFNEVKEALARNNKPTVIFAFNSLMLTGAIKAVQEAGLKIPEDISLICFDEIAGYDIFQPRITCVIQPINKIGDEAIKFLIEKIKNPDSTRKILLLKPELVIGESCRKIGD